MHTAAEYRKYAQECMDSARTATSDEARAQFLELAKLWLSAAVQIDVRTDGRTAWSRPIPTRLVSAE
jgi:hypothetical protein